MTIGHYAVHDLAELLPRMAGEDFDELVRDIKENGLREAICLLPAIHRDPEMILDGRNRLRACLQAGRKPRFTYYTGSTDLASLIEFVRSKNLLRRHLSASQRVNFALMYDEWYRDAAKTRMRNGGARGGRARGKGSADLRHPAGGKSSAALGRDVGASARTVENIRRARKLGAPEVIDAIAAGELAGDTAKDLVRLDPAAQVEVLAESRQSGKTVRSLVKDRLGVAAGESPDADSGLKAMQAAFDRFQALASSAGLALAAARDAAGAAEPVRATLDEAVREFEAVTRRLVEHCRPDAPCPDCEGAGCRQCHGLGWLFKAGGEGGHLRLVSGATVE